MESRMAKRNRGNALKPREVALAKSLIERTDLNDQAIQAYFTRPGRTINHARILEIRRGTRHGTVAAASERELKAFMATWPEHDYVTGLHPDDDELVVKAREAMLNAIQGYNSPRAFFRSEAFIMLAVVAWTYLLHWHYGKLGIDFRSKKDDGTVKTTAHSATKYWELETCLKQAECPLDDATQANLRFLIVIRHEIEHQMTRRIDASLSAKVQACCLNFNASLKRLAGERCGIDHEMSFAIQLSGIEREQRNLLLRDMDLPPNLLAAQEAFEDKLPEAIAKDERYAWRVILVQKNTNSKGAADEVVEFVKPGSELDGEIHRVLRVDGEKLKFRASDIVKEIRAAGFKSFTMNDHTVLHKGLAAKDKRKPFGTFVDIQENDWRWYKRWLEEVLAHCRKTPARYGFKDPNEEQTPSGT